MSRLSIGIVGLPNVGKSTLFNAMTALQVAADNYAFCTIEPNVGIVSIYDDRLEQLSQISGSDTIVQSTIKFVDIAGLVQGAADGEGLGNQFLANIRECEAIVHVVRGFEDSDVMHVHGDVDPIRDIEVINTELLLADLELAEKLCENQRRRTKSGQKEEQQLLALYERLLAALQASTPIRALSFNEKEQGMLKGLGFLTGKKVIYVVNVSEEGLSESPACVADIQAYASKEGDEVLSVCAHLEGELSQLSASEQLEYLTSLGVSERGLNRLAKASFRLLGYQTFLTTGEKETRSWTIRQGDLAPQAAGAIHTDFEKGFIRANVVSFEDFVSCKGFQGAKEQGRLRQEGSEYRMNEGDVVEFLFNV